MDDAIHAAPTLTVIGTKAFSPNVTTHAARVGVALEQRFPLRTARLYSVVSAYERRLISSLHMEVLLCVALVIASTAGLGALSKRVARRRMYKLAIAARRIAVGTALR